MKALLITLLIISSLFVIALLIATIIAGIVGEDWGKWF